MKRHTVNSGCHSCTNCAYQSHSNLTAVQKLIHEGSKIDRLYYGKFLRRHEKKLLERLVRTRAEYDDALSDLLSSSEGSNYKNVETHHKQMVGHEKKSSCCSCCSCSSYRKIKKHLDKHPSHVHKHCVPIEVVKKYVAEAEKRSKNRRNRLSTKISSKIRLARSKVRKIHSEPCQCPFVPSLTSMATTSMTRSSKTLMKKYHPKHKQQHKNKQQLAHKKGSDDVKYKIETCECPCKKICKIPIKSLQKIRSIRGRTDVDSQKKFKIKKDSVTLFKEQAKKKKPVEDFKCDTEECLRRAKKIGDIRKRKQRDQPSGKEHKIKDTRIPKQKTQFTPRETLTDSKSPKKTASSVTSVSKAKKQQKQKTTMEPSKPDKPPKLDHPKAKIKKTKSRKHLKQDQITQPITPTKSVSSMTIKSKVRKPVSPKTKKAKKSLTPKATSCLCPPDSELKSVSSSATKPKKEKKKSGHHKHTKQPEPDIEEEEEEECGKRAVRISSSFKFEIEFSKEVLPCVDYEVDEQVQSKNRGKALKGKKYHTKRAQVSMDKKYGRDSQISFFRESDSQTSRYIPNIIHSRECGTSICKHSKCPVDCEKLLAMTKYSGRSAMTVTDRIKRKSIGSTTSSFMTESRSRYSQSESVELHEPPQLIDKYEDEDSCLSHKRAVKISSSFSFNIEFSKDKCTEDDQDFSEMQHEKVKEVYKPKSKQKGTGAKKMKLGNALTQSTSSQSMKNIQVGHHLKRCFCTLTMLQRKPQKVTHVDSKKIMIDLPAQKKRTRIGKTQTKSPKIAYVYPPDAPPSLLPYECEQSFCTPGECNPNKCLERIKERNRSKESNNTKAPKGSISTLTSMPSTKISAKKMQSNEYIRKKPKMAHSQNTPTEISFKKPGKQLVRVRSSFSLNVEFSKEKIGDDNEFIEYHESQEPLREETKQTQQKGIKMHKPRGRHKAADCFCTEPTTKTKEAHTTPFLQKCFCTLKLLNKGKNKKKQSNTASTYNKNDDMHGMHVPNREITTNRAIITYHRMPKHSVYKCETYESEKRLKQLCDMKVLTDEFSPRSTLSESSRTFSTQLNTQSHLESLEILDQIKRNNLNTNDQQKATRQSQQVAKIGSKSSFDVKLYKKNLLDNEVKKSLHFISNARLLQIKSPYNNKMTSATAGTNDKGIFVDSGYKYGVCPLKFHKRGKMEKLFSACQSTNTSYLSLTTPESKNTTRKRSRAINFWNSESSFDKNLKYQEILKLGNRYFPPEGHESEKCFITSNNSGVSKAKSTRPRFIMQRSSRQETVTGLQRNMSTNSSFSASSQNAHTGSNISFNIDVGKDHLVSAAKRPSHKNQTVKHDKMSDTTSVKKQKVMNIKGEQNALKSHFSRTSISSNTIKQNNASNVSLFKRCLCSLGIQKKKKTTKSRKPENYSVFSNDNDSKKLMASPYNKVNPSNKDRANLCTKNFFELPHIQDLIKPSLSTNETFSEKVPLQWKRHEDNISYPRKAFDKVHKIRYDGAQNVVNSRHFMNTNRINSHLGTGNNEIINEPTTGNTSRFDKNHTEYISDETLKTNPYYQSIYALNLKVSNYKYRHAKKVHRVAKRHVLDDNECEPGFCVPYHCHPIECLKRIRSRNKSSMFSETERSNAKSATSTTTAKLRSRSTDRHHKQTHSFNDCSSNRKHAPGTHPSHHAVTLGSNFEFSMEFSKALPHGSAFISRASQNIKKAKHVATRSCKRHIANVQSQISTISHNKAIGISPALKRCFCTLKLMNKYEPIKPVLRTREEATMARKPFGHGIYCENKHVMTHKLKPYECAPGVCIPGECDPYKCCELIKQRYIKSAEHAVCTDPLKCKSTSILARKQKAHSGSKTVQASHPTHKNKISKKSAPHRMEHPRNKSVKFGSNISFNVEFFKDRTNSFTSDFTPTLAKSKHRIQTTHRRSDVTSSNHVSRKGSGDARKKTRDQCSCTKDDIKTEDRGNCVADMINRCFCTLKLSVSRNAKKGLHDMKSKSATHTKTTSNCTSTHVKEHKEIHKHITHNKTKIPKCKPPAEKKNLTRKKRISKSFEHVGHVGQTTKNKVHTVQHVEICNVNTKRKKSTFGKFSTSSKTNTCSKRSDDSSVKTFINKCLCKFSKSRKKLTPKPSMEVLIPCKKRLGRKSMVKPGFKLEKLRADHGHAKMTHQEMKTIYPYSKKKFKKLESKTKLVAEPKTKCKKKRQKTRKLCPECRVAYETFIGEPITSVPYREPDDDDEPCAHCKSLKTEHKKKSKEKEKNKPTKPKPPRVGEREKNLDSCRECQGSYELQTKSCSDHKHISEDSCPICKGYKHSDIPGYEPVKICTCCKSPYNIIDKVKNIIHREPKPHKHHPLFDLYLNKKMDVVNTDEVFRRIEPSSKTFKAAKKAREVAEEKGDELDEPTEVFIDKHTGRVLNDDEILRKLLPYDQWLKIRKEYYKAALKRGPITCKTLRALNAPLIRSIEHDDSCSCCACVKKRKKRHGKKKKGKATAGKAAGVKAAGGMAPSHGTPTSTGGSSIPGSHSTPTSTGGSSRPGSSRTSTTKKKMVKKRLKRKRKKLNPCICGSPICKNDWERIKRAIKSRKTFKVKKCTCGSDVCYTEAIKVPIRLEKAYYRALKAKEDAIRSKIANRKYQRERLRRKILYAAEDRKRWKQRKRQDKRDMKRLKKRLPRMPEPIKVSDSVFDLTKLQCKAGSDLLRCLFRYSRHPKDGWYDLKDVTKKPKESAYSMVERCEGTGFLATMSRVKKRIASLNATKKVVKTLESYHITNFILHALDRSPKQRLKVIKKKRSRDVNFGCDFSVLAMRWRPYLDFYKKWPKLYPYFVDALLCLKQFADIMLFILACLVWSPCIFCTEFLRALMCCCLCTA